MFEPIHYRNHLARLPQIAVDSSDYSIIETPAAFRRQLLSLINSAKKRIYMTALYLESDQAGEQVLRALLAAKQSNPALDINVFVDFHRANRGRIGEQATQTNRDFYCSLMSEYRYPIGIFGVPVKSRELFGVLHLKGFVFDDSVLYSGASLSNAYLHYQDNYRYDRYHWIRNAQLSDSFVDFMRRHFDHKAVILLDGQALPGRKHRGIRTLLRTLQQACYRFEPTVQSPPLGLTPLCGLGIRKNRFNSVVCDLLRAAEREVFLCTPYFNLSKPIARDINHLLKRGVHVTIVVGDKTANDFYIRPGQPFSTIGGLPYLYEAHLRSYLRQHEKHLKSGHLKVLLWKDGENSYHLKGLVVDQRWHLITGSNLNPRAWRLDFENGLLIDDRVGQLGSQLAQERQRILQHTTQLVSHCDLDALKDYPPEIQRLLTSLRRFKAHLLIKRVI